MDNLNEQEKQYIAQCLWSIRYDKEKNPILSDNDLFFDVMQKLGFAKVGN